MRFSIRLSLLLGGLLVLISSTTALLVNAQTPINDIKAVISFSPETIAQQGISRLSINLTNANALALTNTAFTTNNFAPGLMIADPANITSDCGGTVTEGVGGTSFSLTGGTIPANNGTIDGSCTISINVGATESGNLTASLDAGDLIGYLGEDFYSNAVAASADLNVATFDFNAEVNKSFDPINISPGDTSRLSVSIYNSNTFPLGDAAWGDDLISIQPGLAIANPPNVSTTGCGDTPVVTADQGTTTLALSGAVVPAKVGPINGTCTVAVDVTSTTPGNLINTIPGEVLTATGNEGEFTISNTDPASATLNVDIVTPPSITKAFAPNTIWVGESSRLTIRITNNDATHTLTDVALSDVLNDPAPYDVVLAADVNPTLSAECGSSAALSADPGSNTLSLTNGEIEGTKICQIEVNVTSLTQGTYTNNIPVGSIQTRQGVSNASLAQANLNVQAVGLQKQFTPTTIQAGEISTLKITLRNPTGSDYTGVTFTDIMPGSDLILTGTPTLTTCGSGVASIITTDRADDTIQLTGGTVPAGTHTTPGQCIITVDVTTADSALTRSHVNSIPTGAFTTDVPGFTNIYPASATLNVQALSIGVVKTFSPVSFQQNGVATLIVTLQNRTSLPLHVTQLIDSLPEGLIPDPGTVETDCENGLVAAAVGTPSTLTLYGGAIIPAGSVAVPGHCYFSVDVTATDAKTYTNTILQNSIVTEEGPTNLDSATRNIIVYPTGMGMTGSKSFSNSSIIAGGNSRLRIQLRAPDDQDLTGVTLTDNLPTNVTVSNSTAASNSCGGTLTAATGASAITLTGGSIAKSVTCTIDVYVTSALSGTYTNTINPTDIDNTQHQRPPGSFSSTLTVSNMTISKAFYPDTVAPNGRSTLTITLSNNNTSPLTNVSINPDNLNTLGGTDITIANPSNASTTCESGTVGAAPGAQLITLSNAIIPAKVGSVSGICTVSVDVIASSSVTPLPTTRTNTLNRSDVSGTVSGIGVIHPVANATAPLTITNLTLGVVKGFNPLTVFGGSASTMSVQLINPNSTALTGISFTDTMPAGMYIANPPNTSTGTCGGTLTAVPETGSFVFSGGALTAGRRCTLTIDATMNVHGNRTNTIAANAVTSFNGAKNLQAASASLTNLPGASVSKFFTPNTMILGNTSLLTIQIKNTGNIALSAVGLIDTLPSGLVIANSPVYTNTCNGSITATAGLANIQLTAGSIVAGPDTTCEIVVPVTSSSAGIYTNTIDKNKLQTSEGATNTEPAIDTLTITTPPNLQLTKTLNVAASSLAPYTTGDNLVYSLVATNMGDVNVTNVTVTDSIAIVGTCSPAQPATLTPGQSITCPATYQLVGTEGDAFTNTATADSTETEPVTDSVTVPLNQSAILSINKSITNTGPYQLGDTLNYSITVTNDGVIDLHNVTVNDPGVILGTCTPAQPATLTPTTSMVCAASHVIVQADVDAGTFSNIATADSDETEAVTDTVTVPVEDNAKLEVFKQITSNSPYNTVGKRITYDISAINTGGLPLTGVTITDPGVGVTLESCTPSQPATLAIGQILSCTAYHDVTEDDLTDGGYSNTAIADSNETTPVSDTVMVITKTPTITLLKEGQILWGDNTRPDAGEYIRYFFTITNTGEVTLNNISLTDVVGGIDIMKFPPDGEPPEWQLNLAPGEVDSTTFQGFHQLTQEDINSGSFTNTAIVTGYPPVGSPVSAAASDTRSFLSQPQIILLKNGTVQADIVAPNSRVDVGDTLSYTFEIINPGNVPLTDVTLSDPSITLSGSPFSLGIGVTDIGAYSGTYTLTQADIDAGKYDNNATVTGKPPTGDNVTYPSNFSLELLADKQISITKTGTLNFGGDGRADAGDTITYIFSVSNPGNVTLSNVTITDPAATITGGPITLIPGAVDNTTFTGTHTLTQADIDAATFTNTATVHGTPPAGGEITATDTDTKNFTQESSIVLEKTGTLNMTIVAPNGVANVGDKIAYTLKVTNTGNVTLSSVAVTDPVITVSGSPISSLLPGTGNAVTLTGTYTLTQADVDAGTFSNTASVTGNPPIGVAVSDTDDDTQTLVPASTMTLTKTGTLHRDVVGSATVTEPGDTITYTFSVKNTGNVTLSNITLSDPKVTISGGPIVSLAPGVTDSTTFTAVHSLTQADIDAVTYNNTATVSGTTPKGVTVTATGSESKGGLATPSISLVKTGTVDMSVVAPNTRVDAGDKINYTFVVTNTGNVVLNPVTVTDTKASMLGGPISLAIGASDSTTFTASHTLTQADVDAGTYANAATASGKPPTGSNVTSASSDTKPLAADRQITLLKTGTVDLTVVPPVDVANAGDKINYTFAVSNPGNVTLTNVTVTDPKVSVTGAAMTLLPGQADSTHFTGTYTLTQADIDLGTFSNTATISGKPPLVSAITTTSTDNKAFTSVPSIALEKTGTIDMGVVSPAGVVNAGDVINYTFKVTNTGNVTLSNVTITDPDPKVVLLGGPILIPSLSPGAGNAVTRTGTVTLTQADIDAGVYSNTASTSGTPPTGDPVTHSDGDSQVFPSAPSISLVKTGTLNQTIAGLPGVTNPNDQIVYTFTITNTGNVTLTNINVTDPKISVLGFPITLTPGASDSTSFTGTFTLTQAEINAGTFTNTATATGSPPTGNPVTGTDDDTQNGLATPSITLVKTGTLHQDVVAPGSRVDAGDTITYTFTITNTGNVDLTNVSVTDPKITVLGSPISLAIGVGNNSTFTGTYTLTQTDINAGTFSNTATATGTPPTGGNVSGQSTDTKTLTADKRVTLVKTGVMDMNLVDPDGIANVGDKISYTFTVSNPGNVPLTNVSLTDPKATLFGAPISLAPGGTDSTTFTGEYYLTQADLDADSFTNTATATGTPPIGSPVTGSDDDTQIELSSPSITLEKTGTVNEGSNGRVDVGDTISYSFVVTNTGNVPLTNVLITDPKITVLGSPISLAAGGSDSSNFTGTYTLTQTDVDDGGFDNTAEVSGTSPTSEIVTASDIDEQELAADKSITLVKTGTLHKEIVPLIDEVNVGDTITYQFTITNTGNVTLTYVSVSDPVTGMVISGTPIDSLAPGATDNTTYTGTYTLNQTDVDAGTFENTATVKGTPPSGEDITSTGDFTQFLSDRPMIGVAKRVVSVTKVSAGTHDVTIEFRLKNYGNVTLHDIYLTDDLTETFPLPTTFSVQSVSSPDTSLLLNPAYDGDTDINLLLAGNILDVDQTRIVTLVARVIPTSRGPYTNTAWAYGTSPVDVTVDDQSQNGTDADPGPDADDDPTNNNEVTPIDFPARIFDPPFGIKTVNSSGVPLLKWTMVWINNTNIVDVHAIVHDPIPVHTVFEPGLVDSGFPIPAGVPDGSTSLGVSCTSSLETTTDQCYYEGPTLENPLGQIVWEGTLGPDLGVTRAADAINAVTISFNVRVSNSTVVSNRATIDSDLNGDGDAIDIDLITPNLNERRVSEANFVWDVTPRGMPNTGFAPDRITPLTEPQVDYTNLGDVWLKIPSLGIEIPVVGVPEVTNGWDVTWLGNDAGWLNGTAFPTFAGNSVITGHVYDANGKPGPFMNLTNLKYGDAVIIRAYGFTYTFEVRELLTVAPTDLKEALKHQEEPWITLQTCQGYNEADKSYSSRVLVRAVLSKVE